MGASTLTSPPEGQLFAKRQTGRRRVTAGALVVLAVLFFNLLPISKALIPFGGLSTQALGLFAIGLLVLGAPFLRGAPLTPAPPFYLTLALGAAYFFEIVLRGFFVQRVDFMSLYLAFALFFLVACRFFPTLDLSKTARVLLTVLCVLYALEFILSLIFGASIYRAGPPFLHLDRVDFKEAERVVDVGSFLFSSAFINLPGSPFLPIGFKQAGVAGEPHLSVLALIALYLLSDRPNKFHTALVWLSCIFFFSVSVGFGLAAGLLVSTTRLRSRFELFLLLTAFFTAAIAAVVIGDKIYAEIALKFLSRSWEETITGYRHILESALSFSLEGSLTTFPNFYNDFQAPMINPISAWILIGIYVATIIYCARLSRHLSFHRKVYLWVFVSIFLKAPVVLCSFPVCVFLLDYLYANRFSSKGKPAILVGRP